MFSFKSLAVFSTLAFGALSALAVPVLDHNNVDANAVVVARCDCDSVPNIIADVTVAIAPYIYTLQHTTSSNCTVEALTPVVLGIKAELSTAIVNVKALIGQPAAVILAGVDVSAVVSVSVLAKLVADLIIPLFVAIRVCLGVCGASVLACVLPLFCSLGEVVGALVYAVLSVTAGLLVGLDVAIVALLTVVVDVFVKLNLSVLVSILGIKL